MDDDREAKMFVHKSMIFGLAGLVSLAFSYSTHAESALAEGQALFDENCVFCHQADAIGKPGFLNKASDGFIRETIKLGRSNTRMLPFQGAEGLSNMSDQEIDDIITYMRTLN